MPTSEVKEEQAEDEPLPPLPVVFTRFTSDRGLLPPLRPSLETLPGQTRPRFKAGFKVGPSINMMDIRLPPDFVELPTEFSRFSLDGEDWP